MSWQALKWAAHQRAGSLSANAVLRVYADHASKTGRTFVDSKTIAEELETTKPTVLDAIGRILKRGLMEDTGERVGKTGSVRVFQLKMASKASGKGESSLTVKRSNSFTAKRYRSGKEAVKKQSNSFTAGRGETASNLYPLTRGGVEDSPPPLLYKDEEKNKSRGGLRPPTNDAAEESKDESRAAFRPPTDEEFYTYIFGGGGGDDDPNHEAKESLKRFFVRLDVNDPEEAERNGRWFLRENSKSGWKYCKGDWRQYLLSTFDRGMFPSQRRPPKKGQER